MKEASQRSKILYNTIGWKLCLSHGKPYYQRCRCSYGCHLGVAEIRMYAHERNHGAIDMYKAYLKIDVRVGAFSHVSFAMCPVFDYGDSIALTELIWFCKMFVFRMHKKSQIHALS